MKTTPKLKKYSMNSIFSYGQEVISEFIGTLILVFAGSGAVMVNSISDASLTQPRGKFCFRRGSSCGNL